MDKILFHCKQIRMAWLANLEIAKRLLADVETIYPGHGVPAGLELLETQSRYLLAYCAAVKELAHGKPTLSEEAKNVPFSVTFYVGSAYTGTIYRPGSLLTFK